MAKRLSQHQKDTIVDHFRNGKTVEQLAKGYNCTKATIVRNLKKIIGESGYKKILKPSEFNIENSIENSSDRVLETFLDDQTVQENPKFSTFIELPPLEVDLNNEKQKDLSSIPIADIQLPSIVFMIVDKNIELETKLLSDYPKWSFLSNSDLKRKTIEIFSDIKLAKRSCNKDQKVIKVPNTNVFSLTASILLSKGISRIISDENLIAL